MLFTARDFSSMIAGPDPIPYKIITALRMTSTTGQTTGRGEIT